MPLSLLPAPGAFVAFSIDPVATLASLNDPVATAAAESMPRQTYVGYVNKVVDAFDCKAAYHTYVISLSSPAPCADACIGADMYTPVSPAATHPLGREALRPSKELPWPCVQPSFMRTVVRVPVKLEDDSAAVFLPPADVTRHRRILAGEDARRAVALRSASPAPEAGSSSSYVDFSDLDDGVGDFRCPIDVEDQWCADGADADAAPDTTIVVAVSYDLTEVGALPNPVGFFEQKRRLKQLEAESWARKATASEISTPEVADITIQQANELMPHETRPPVYPDTPSSQWVPERLLSIRIPASVIREVATTTRRFSVSLARLRAEGLHLLRSWTIAVRPI
ncbi:hypothetical protein DFH07DRAFT_1065922 [Mycena maculata]|uniref:Uncharacterized protein n=1 Tax=Mycena maculata TaxID=230809 RepID=A0AAD7HZN8_9AGAR|nr:hypothetical protein DFH07DRAFT_1065922 [Mycena maculata]